MPPVERPWEQVGQMGRRRFLQLMSSSLALLGFSSCARFRPPSEALPYVHPPAEVMPGERDFYATCLPFAGYGRGVVVECVMGRPVKVDGHPDHPSTLGGSDAALQACLLELYDPDRPNQVRWKGKPSTVQALHSFLEKQRDLGSGVHIVTPHLHSSSLQNLIEERFSAATWHRLDAFPQGELRPHYQLDKSDLVVSFGLDFLGEHPNRVRYARDFSRRREPSNMSKVWVYDSHPTLSKIAADHQGNLTPYQQNAMLERILNGAPSVEEERVLLELLETHRGRGLVMGGAAVDSTLVHQANEQWENAGKTVSYSRDALPATGLNDLRAALEAGEVELLIVLGGDPCYLSGDTLPVSLAKHSVHLSYRPTLTSQRCEWSVPGLHPLESWGDLRSYDGTASLTQPVIEPLTGGWSSYRLLATLAGDRRPDFELVKDFWTARGRDWKEGLASGVIDPSPWPEFDFRPEATKRASIPEGPVVEFRPDPYLHDGMATTNPWLLELPRPVTRLAWNNAVLVNREWAEKEGLTDGDHLQIRTAIGNLTAPIFVSSSQAAGVFVVTTGWGQTQAGRFGSGQGYDAFRLRGAAEEAFLPVEVQVVEGRSELISTQHHQQMEGRHLIRHGELEEWKKEPSLGIEPPPEDSLYPESTTAARRWGMVIDLTKCIGCNACVAACGAENNLPVVGPEQTSRGRAMHWLRVDHYEDPHSSFQPVPCMHCENAPCEQVCPVEATLHNKEGLNQMVYNRCVGTRYCSNNCPYKVRRFNFLDFTNPEIEEWDMVRNPEVTVRSRGVMEKCSYCVQRIEAADIRSRLEEREIEDGEVITACQAACPTRAIVFGDLEDPESEVSRLAALPHNYGLLAELGTRPRTTYLARLRNGEPED